MAISKKLLDADYDPITVFSFSGSIIIPTEQGSYWATAVGGVVENRPTGNPFVLFSLRYIWDMAGTVSEFPEPIMIKLNTAMAVTEKFDFEFPALEVPPTDELLVQATQEAAAIAVESEDVGGDEVEDEDLEDTGGGEGLEENWGDEDDEILAQRAEDEISW